MRFRALVFATLVASPCAGTAEEHEHHHATGEKEVKPPRIFLDKSRRIVEYQLKRLSNERLLLVERDTGDTKYAPVYAAILARAGMSPQYREEALAALVMIERSSPARELLTVLGRFDPADRQQRRTARELANLLLRLPPGVLRSQAALLRSATDSRSSLVRSIAYAGLVVAGESADAWSRAQRTQEATIDWLAAVSLVADAALRSSLRDPIVRCLSDSRSLEVRRAALGAIAAVPERQDETFQLVVPLVRDVRLRSAAVRTLLSIPSLHRDPAASRTLVESLLEYADATPAAERTTDAFLEAMQLADQVLARLAVDVARSYRERLRSRSVRVVRILTVEEEMRYDTAYFAVEAGRPVQVVLQNEDLMPHNLVVTLPGALKEVAELGFAAGPGGHGGKPYVPESDKVLFATDMVQPGQRERLTFTAPETLGEYPYVCTFPRHWMRMYGVMVVVEDVDAWLQNPTPPKDPIGSDRAFVSAWSIDDLRRDLPNGLRGRTIEIGTRLFTEATCAQCHAVKGVGGAAGPELTGVFSRFEGDREAVLREILEPSHRIDPKYAVHVIITGEGRVLTGILTAASETSVSILENPESSEPIVIRRADIAEMVQTSKSMMPKGLLDRFTKDEIFELLAYLEASVPVVK